MGDGEHYNLGAALKAHRIAFSTRKFAELKVTQASGAHRGTTGTLVNNSYCVIETPLRAYTEGTGKAKVKKKGASPIAPSRKKKS